MKPRWVRALVVLVGVAVIAVALGTIVDRPTVEVTYVVSTDAEELLQPIVDEFNEDDVTVDGHRIDVELVAVSSGAAVKAISEGRMKPAAWTPASSLWARLLRKQLPRTTLERNRGALVQSPEVFAIFESSRRKYELSEDASFKNVLDATHAGMKLGHTDPNLSTSGLYAVLAEFNIAANKLGSEVLTMRDATRGTEEVKDIESRIAHYVDIGRDFTDEWCEYGNDFADAAYMQETTFLELTKKNCDDIVAVYPSDLEYQADYPFVTFSRSGKSDLQQKAAEQLGHYVDERLRENDCERVLASGFRKQGCTGVAAPRVPLTSFKPPSAATLAELQDRWGDVRRPATVMLVVDESIAMAEDGRFRHMKDALLKGTEDQNALVGCLRAQDHFGIFVFGGDQGTAPVASLAPYERSEAASQIDLLEPSRTGRQTLYDALQRAFLSEGMSDPRRINTIVLMYYGSDDRSQTSPTVIKDHFNSSDPPVQIVAVSYGEEWLDEEIMRASLGRHFDGDGTDIPAVAKFVCGFL